MQCQTMSNFIGNEADGRDEGIFTEGPLSPDHNITSCLPVVWEAFLPVSEALWEGADG